MTQQGDVFQTATTAHLLTPDASGAALLWDAVQGQLSLKASPVSQAPLRAFEEGRQRLYCESSGSSGQPKLIRRSPASWRASFEINRDRLAIDAGDAYAVLGHPGHSLVLYGALEALHIGAGLAMLAGLRPDQQAAALLHHQISTIYATPSQFMLIARAGNYVFPAVKRVLFGGGSPTPSFRDLMARHFPAAQIIEFYGASETSFITMSDNQTPLGSVGRAYPGVTLRIGDGVPVGEAGEIWVKSPYLFDGYESGASPFTRWQDGFLSVGEVGALDAAGYLYLGGRRSRMVTVADQNVFPEAIEAVLLAQPGVVNAAVITPDDALRGHVIVAAVVGAADADVLRQACRAQLGNAAVPRTVWTIADMPMLPAGKPDLQRLETLWRSNRT